MTISANSDFNPELDTVLRMGLQLAGLVPLGKSASAPQLAHARFFLDVLLKSMKNGVYMLAQREPTTLALVAGTSTYTLPVDTIEIDFPIMLTAPGATVQTQVDQIAYDRYQETVDKQTRSLPIQCYVEKLSVVTLYFWPTPDQAYTASYRRRRLVRNADSGTTLDATPGWIRGVAYQIAADMGRAGSMDQATITDRQNMADRELSQAEARENDESPMQFVLPDYR